MVNTIGADSGSRWINIHDNTRTTTFTITAKGRWKLTIADVDSVKPVDSKASGHGGSVVYLTGPVTLAAISNQGEGNFAVEVLSAAAGFDLAVNEIGSSSVQGS